MKSEIIILFISAIIFLYVSPVLAQNGTYDNFSQQTEVVSSQSSKATEYNPSASRLALQFGSGALFGAASGAAGFLGGAMLAPDAEGPAGLVVLGYGAVGAIVTYPLGSALGIYMVANTNRFDASFGNILLGTSIGTGAGIGTIILSSGIGKGAPIAIASGLALSLPIVGGIIFNQKSIQKRTSGSSALLNISDGNTSLSAPSVKLTRVGNFNTSSNFADTYSPTVKLLNISL